MTGLPYPTPTRLDLADAIVARHIRHYHFIVPSTLDTVRNREVTARVKEFVAAGLAEYGTPEGADVVRNWSTVRLTPEGMAWVTRARTADTKITAGGPVSTSPETGPEPCVQCCGEPGCLRHGCKHARAESTKDGT